jgi:hypothetical protein
MPDDNGLNGAVFIVANCNPKGAGFDFRVMLGKEANLSRNPIFTRLLRQYLIFFAF